MGSSARRVLEWPGEGRSAGQLTGRPACSHGEPVARRGRRARPAGGRAERVGSRRSASSISPLVTPGAVTVSGWTQRRRSNPFAAARKANGYVSGACPAHSSRTHLWRSVRSEARWQKSRLERTRSGRDGSASRARHSTSLPVKVMRRRRSIRSPELPGSVGGPRSTIFRRRKRC